MIKYTNPELEIITVETEDIFLASQEVKPGAGTGDIETGEDEI